MNLVESLIVIDKILTDLGVNHALIGGFALAAHGVHRATNDIDFLVNEADRDILIANLPRFHWSLAAATEEVLHFVGDYAIDFILARRPLSQEMLREATQIPKLGVKAVSAEGLIGLKIQAYCNNPKRKLQDKADILALMRTNPSVDLNRVKQYADLFDQWEEILLLRKDL
ncbi:MAG: hypothetical protein WCI18_14970 [Pseudomonadota bacterium]